MKNTKTVWAAVYSLINGGGTRVKVAETAPEMREFLAELDRGLYDLVSIGLTNKTA